MKAGVHAHTLTFYSFTHTNERSCVADVLTTEQHSLLASTYCIFCHVTWCQKMLMLHPIVAQSRLLSDIASVSSFRQIGSCSCQSLHHDWTQGLTVSRLLPISPCFHSVTVLLDTHMFHITSKLLPEEEKQLGARLQNKPVGLVSLKENTSV